MRRIIVIALCVLSFLVSLPAPAHAWWDWLDEFSGPGPFTGFDLQWRLACINDKLPEEKPNTPLARNWLAERDKRRAALDILLDPLPPTPANSPDRQTEIDMARKRLEEAETELKKAVEIIRKSVDPGDYVLRSLASFEGKRQAWAALSGAGCLSQFKSNPIGSLNFRLAFLWSIHNQLKYKEAKYANDGPQVKLLQPELSFTVFVDQRKSVELGSAMGVSTAFIDKEGVSPFSRFYWRPFILTISPVSLLRLNIPKGWRALTLSSSIVIMPQELNDTDFGARPGTFHTGREMQGLFGVVLDLSRF